MESSGDPGLLHLRKLSPPEPEGEVALGEVLEKLWRTRHSGLGPHDRSHLQSLLCLPSPRDLLPVLAALRSIIRKCVNEKLTGEQIQNLFPKDLSLEIRNVLVVLLQKYQGQWMGEASREQVRSDMSRAIASFPASSLWPRQSNSTSYYNENNTDACTMSSADLNSSSVPSARFGQSSSDKQATFQRLKSITWTMERRNSTAASRMAIVTLKLQDNANSSGETEEKFRISKDSLEAMLRSMAHLRERLSISAAAASELSTERQS